MKTSDTQAALVAALFAAKGAFPHIAKTKQGQSGNRTFNYAPLDAINDAVDPILRKHGLMITHSVEGHMLITRLEHESGEWREVHMPVNAEHANMQSYGIEVTYRRRYSVPLILGIVTEDDKDIKERSRRKGLDHTDGTEDKEKPATRKGGDSGSPTAIALASLDEDSQRFVRQVAQRVTAAMPDAHKALEIWEMADLDDETRKAAAWGLLDSATRSGIKRAKTEVSA